MQARAAAPSEAAGNAGSADIAAWFWVRAIERQQHEAKVLQRPPPPLIMLIGSRKESASVRASWACRL